MTHKQTNITNNTFYFLVFFFSLFPLPSHTLPKFNTLSSSLIFSMNSEKNRLATFQAWPTSIWDPHILARTGCYTAFANAITYIQCKFCTLTFTEYPENVYEVNYHRQRAPHCPLLSGKRTDNVPIDQDLFQSTICIYPPTSEPLCISFPMTLEDFPQSFTQKLSRKRSFITASPRLQTFANSLSLAGFYHTNNNITQCYCCHLQVSNWNEHYDPWLIHIKESPFCSHIINLVDPTQIFDVIQDYTDNSLVVLPTSFNSVPTLSPLVSPPPNPTFVANPISPQSLPTVPKSTLKNCPKDQLTIDTYSTNDESIDMSELDKYILDNQSHPTGENKRNRRI